MSVIIDLQPRTTYRARHHALTRDSSMSILEFSRPAMPPGRARALVFESPLSRSLLTLLEQIAPTDTTVLVTGETGTGKEVVARFLHDHSARAKGPYVAVNCG